MAESSELSSRNVNIEETLSTRPVFLEAQTRSHWDAYRCYIGHSMYYWPEYLPI